MAEYAIIAGKGELPLVILKQLPQAKVICFEGEHHPEIHPDLLTKFGKVSEILEFLKSNEVKKIIFAGAMRRPNLKEIGMDSEGAKLLAKIMTGSLFGKSVGDDKLLSVITKYLEEKGFEIVAPNEITGQLTTPKKNLSAATPDEAQKADIELGLNVLRKTGELDIGQAVVVEDGVVLAVEAVEGTAAMIERAGRLKKSYGGVLVKAKKTGQEERVDLPAIGVETIRQLQGAGIAGVALEAGGTMIISQDEVIKLANAGNIFVIGV